MKSQREYMYWDEECKLKLIETCTQCINFKGQINWDDVQLRFPDRTRQQCKSYYTNSLKQKFNIESKHYHSWTDQETRLLVTAAKEENKDWNIIHEKFFPNMRPKQLQTKYFNSRRGDSAQDKSILNQSSRNVSTDTFEVPSQSQLIQQLECILFMIQ